MDEFISLLTNQILPHWPFLAVTAILTIVGQFTSKSVFTKEKAYQQGKYQFFWWWGRETLPLHPILSAALIGFFWDNPEGADPAWSRVASYFYFAAAGVVSLFAWSILKGTLKSRGIDIDIFAQSMPPSPLPPKELKDYLPVVSNSKPPVQDSDIIEEDSSNA